MTKLAGTPLRIGIIELLGHFQAESMCHCTAVRGRQQVTACDYDRLVNRYVR
jgi:hypothetical protein